MGRKIMTVKREHKHDDNDLIMKTRDILYQTIAKFPEIEGKLWIDVMLRIIAEVHHASHIPHEEYKEEIIRALDYYKCFWEGNDAIL